MNSFKTAFEEKLDNMLPEVDSRYKDVVDSMRYSLLDGGKRIRPLMLYEFYKLCGGKDDSYINFSVALEMIHTYSLIHDDLPCMDNDDFRRGRPSNHKRFGEDIALLAGDGLLTEAFLIASATKGISSERVLRAIGILSRYAGYRGMIGGQVIDLQSEGNKVDGDTVDELNLLKTGGLIQAAAVIGCVLAGADNKRLELAAEYGKSVGIAFQLIDDILDVTSSDEELGKPVHSDEKNEKSTYITIYGMDYCKEYAKKLTENALSLLDKFDGDKEPLVKLTEGLLRRKY